MPRLKLPKARMMTAPASLFRRFVAFLADLVIIDFFIIGPFRGYLTGIVPESSIGAIARFLSENPGIMNQLVIVLSIISALSIAYFAILEFKLGQTLGKILMNITVVSDKKKLSLWQCILRNVFLTPIFPFVLLWVIEPVFLIFWRRRLLEILSRTRTVQSVVVG
ncbi:MAG: RDD family protein [Nanoarchaeota archaeon]